MTKSKTPTTENEMVAVLLTRKDAFDWMTATTAQLVADVRKSSITFEDDEPLLRLNGALARGLAECKEAVVAPHSQRQERIAVVARLLTAVDDLIAAASNPDPISDIVWEVPRKQLWELIDARELLRGLDEEKP